MTNLLLSVLRAALVAGLLPAALLLGGCAEPGSPTRDTAGEAVVVAQEAPSAVPVVSVPADAEGPAAGGLVQAVPPPPPVVAPPPPPADRSGRSQDRAPRAVAGPAARAPGASGRPAPAPVSGGSRAGSMAAAVNAQRSAHGLGPLASSGCAQRYAQTWAAHVASTGAWGHQSLRPVLSGCSASLAGENIARGGGATGETVSAWMASPGHRANILEPAYTHSGVASVQAPDGRWVTVQVFLKL